LKQTVDALLFVYAAACIALHSLIFEQKLCVSVVPPHTIIRQRRLGYNSIVALILFHSEEYLDPDFLMIAECTKSRHS